MVETSPTNPKVIVVSQAGQSIDLSGVNDTTILALGAADQIDLFGEDYEDGEGSGDTVVVTGRGSDVILGSSDGVGANDVQLFGQDDAVTESPDASGSDDTIEANAKGASIDIGGYNSVVLNGTDNVMTLEPVLRADSYDPFGDNTVVANGTGKETVTGGGQAFTFTGGDGRYLISGGGAEDTTISGGAGGGVFIGGYFYRSDYLSFPDYIGRNVITAGLQASTLIGSAHGSSLLIANGSGHDVLMAGEYGNDTLSGGTSTGNNTYEGYNGPYVPSDDRTIPSLVIEAGSGNDLLIGGLAAETLTGGTGHDLFRFLAHAAGAIPSGGDHTVITDFTPGLDKIDLRGFTVTSEQVVAAETISQGSTHLSLPDGQKITLLHITDLSPKDFTKS